MPHMQGRTAMHPLEERIVNARKAGRTALVPFLTAEFPTAQTFWQALEELDDCGADIIEIGVPFSDPVADGPVIEEASRRVLERGVSLCSLLEELKARRGRFRSGLVLMGYLNPFMQYGYEKFAKDAAEAGVEGLIVPDLPYEESAAFQKCLGEKNIALIPLVGPNTGEDRMALYARDAKGYVYVVSVMGITGERKKLAEGVAATMDRARKMFNVPVALGFGLKEPQQLDELPEKSRPDAAVFGSALLRHLDQGKSAREFIAKWL